MKYVIQIHFLIALYLTLFTTNAIAQSPDLKGQLVVPGTINRDGKQIEGYILKMGSGSIPFSVSNTKYSTPWVFQKEIRFMDKAKFESLPKIKYKDYEKLEPGDIQGYSYNNDSLIFDSRKYANLSSAGLGMIPKMTFIRRVTKHKISIYKYYNQPSGNGPEDKQLSEYKESSKANLVYCKEGEDNAKILNLMNVEKQLGECPKVVEKYKKGEYKSIGFEYKEDPDLLANASEGDISKLYAIVEYNKNLCN